MTKMRNYLNGPTMLSSMAVLPAVLTFSPVSHAQGGQQAAPNQGQRRAAPPSPTANLPFDPHDLSGIWRYGGALSSNNAPPMTPAGKAKYDANIPGVGGEPGRDKPFG